MPENDAICGGAVHSDKKNHFLKSFLYDLLRMRKAREASVTESLVVRYGEEGRLVEEELVTRIRECRRSAQARRDEALSLGRESIATGMSTKADLLRKAALLENRASKYELMLKKRVEGMLACAAARLYPKGTFAYQELRDDFLVVAAMGLNNALGSNRPHFEIRFISALLSVILTAARSVYRANDRGSDGRQTLPIELDAPTNRPQEDDTPGVTIGETLAAPSEETPEALALLVATITQLRILVCTALSQQGELALRKFDVLCLRCADLKSGEVRSVITARYPGSGYSSESERLDYRHAIDALRKAVTSDASTRLEMEDGRVISALRYEGQRLTLESDPE
ncbi:hypothetical protein [Armatimonas sp.]|uniref:hypothetical protein n=1 Tax=Armatimonas sp. TaxID=1872638 RepID=UPI00374D4352